MRTGTYTATNSDLFWKVYKIYNINNTHVKAKIMFFYKSNNNIVWHLNTEGKPKDFKIIKEVANEWTQYDPYNTRR